MFRLQPTTTVFILAVAALLSFNTGQAQATDPIVKVEPRPSLKILRDGSAISQLNNKVLPGQKINLTLDFKDANPQVTDITWDIPGVIFKDYTADNNEAIKTPIFPEDETWDHISFYWADSAPVRVVTCNAKVNGQLVNATANFQVSNPNSLLQRLTFGKSTYGSVNLPGKTVYRMGLYPDGDEPNEGTGIRLTASVATPSDSAAGQWYYVQTVKSNISRTPSNVFIILPKEYGPYSGQWTIDTHMPYDGYNPTGSQSKEFTDTPLFEFNTDNPSDFLEWTRSDQFNTFIMFIPPGQDSRAVPLKSISWGWSGTLVANNGHWQEKQPIATYFTQNISASSSDTTDHPLWNVYNGSMNYGAATSAFGYGPLAISAPSSVKEGETAFQVEISTLDPVSALLFPDGIPIHITSSDTSAVSVPSSVTIPAGQSKITFAANILDNNIKEWTKLIKINASVSDPDIVAYQSNMSVIFVRDND